GEISEKYRPAIKKGLDWLVKQQHKDGHWSANSEQYPVAMTALAGLALLMDGSTASTGPHAKSIRRAADWVMHECRNPNGLISKLDDLGEAGRYTFGHGYAILFLASLYENEQDRALRHELQGVLNRAVQFTASAQTTRGGWGYISA